MTTNMKIVLDRLRAASESTFTDAAGNEWGTVYLDNAIPDGMDKHVFAGTLSALEKVGLYEPCRTGDVYDGVFGDVRLTEGTEP